MKRTVLRIALAVIGIAGAAIIISCVCQNPRSVGSDKIVFDEYSIFIPGTAVTKDDQKAMNDVLAHYRTALYRIETYQDGTRSQSRGTLPEAAIGEAAFSQARANANRRHLDGSAIQVGFSIGTRHYSGAPIGTHHATPTPGAPIGTHHVTPTPGTTIGTRHTTPPPGAPIGTKYHATPTPGETAPASDKDYEEAAELVKRLKPILEKYGQK